MNTWGKIVWGLSMLVGVDAAAQSTFNLTNQSATAFRIGAPPVIDGRLDESLWLTAPCATNFTQSRPYPRSAPTHCTEVWIAYDDQSGSFPFKASGRARASMDTDGLVKVLAHADTDEILGVHMCGPRAADMIAEAVVAMEFRASAEDISRMSHAHPTFTEAIKEAALAATENRALHI